MKLKHGDTENTEKFEEVVMLFEEELTRQIIGAAIEVHKRLGPGLLESIYEICMAYEMTLRGLAFEKQKALTVEYKGMHLESDYRLDFIVEGKIVVELKAVEKVLPIHEAQLLTYMRLTGCKVGLIINFNVPILKDGIVRRVL
jgi:GxxExxY protein